MKCSTAAGFAALVTTAAIGCGGDRDRDVNKYRDIPRQATPSTTQKSTPATALKPATQASTAGKPPVADGTRKPR